MNRIVKRLLAAALPLALLTSISFAQVTPGSGPCTIAKGCTGSSTAAGARTNLAVPYLYGFNVFDLGSGTAPTADTGTIIHVVNVDGTVSRIEATAFGAASFFSARRAGGTRASPTAVTTDDQLGAFNFHGWYASAWSGPQASIGGYAAAGWTSSSTPTYLDLKTTPASSTTLTSRVRVEKDGGITVPPTVTGGSKGAGTLNVSGGYYVNGNQFGITNLAGTAANRLFGTDGSGNPTVITLPAAGLSLSGSAIALANDLAAVEALSGTGMAARTATDTWAVRTITAPAAGITVTNGDGVAGNPTLSLANDLAALEGLSSAGLAARTATDTWAVRTITAPAAGITVSNGDGVSGNPTLALANDLAALEGLSSTGIARRTGTDAWSVGTLVTNAELANMANATFKCRNTTGTGSPEDCTATQSTALLNAMVGDSGTGGTKGLVPAPGAGDASGGKFLKADGTWAVPAGGGGGGSYADTDRRNALLVCAYQAKTYGFRRVIGTACDGFKDATGINAGSSSNYAVDGTGLYVAPTVSLTATPSYANTLGTGNRTGSITVSTSASLFDGSSTANKIVDGSTGSSYSNSVAFTASTAASGAYIRFDLGSGANKVITEVTWYQSLTSSHGTWKWQGSNDASTWTDIGSSFTLGGATTQTQTSLSGNTSGYRYYQLAGVSGTVSSAPYVQEIEFKIDNYAATTNNMTVITAAQTADSSVSNIRALLEFNPVVSITLNTDLTVRGTCNGGTNWSSMTLSSISTNGQNGRTVVETADTAVTAGTSCALEIKNLNNKSLQVHAATATFH